MKPSTIALSLLIVCLASTAALGQNDIYDNGPTNGQDLGWTINTGFAVSDSFALENNSQVNGLTFSAWLYRGDILVDGEVSITSSEFGGTTYFDQFVNFTQTDCSTNQLAFNVCNETASFAAVSLNAGTYWLTLQNAQTNTTNDPVYWDQNSGPSLASQNSLGTTPSESFTILGSSGSSTGTTPEPNSILLFGSGLVAVFRKRAVLGRRNIRRASLFLIVALLLVPCVGQQSNHSVTLAGCVMSVNGEFHLLTRDKTYVLKGKHDTLLGYSGKQVEVTGTTNSGSESSPQGVSVVLHVAKVKKVADFCQ